jgi:predicted SPOUT superfamily RNA methylase MTH1
MTRTVLVPSSLVREAEDKREATRKLGYVGRAAAVFRIDRLVVYPDTGGDDGRYGGGLVATVLAYAATPPYLRKEVWDVRNELEHVGVLPPLRLGSQTGSGSSGSGSLRQGIVTRVGPDGHVRVNCGLQHPVSLPVPPSLEAPSEGERVTIRVSSRRPLRVKLVDEPLPGFTVERETVETSLRRSDAGLCLAASRHGQELTVSQLDGLVQQITDIGGLTVVFGAPDRGLPEIFGCEPGEETVSSVDTSDESDRTEPQSRFDLWLNTVPTQGSDVVRTEEAMFATLAPLSLDR